MIVGLWMLTKIKRKVLLGGWHNTYNYWLWLKRKQNSLLEPNMIFSTLSVLPKSFLLLSFYTLIYLAVRFLNDNISVSIQFYKLKFFRWNVTGLLVIPGHKILELYNLLVQVRFAALTSYLVQQTLYTSCNILSNYFCIKIIKGF